MRRGLVLAGVAAAAFVMVGEPDGRDDFDALHGRLSAKQAASYPFDVRLPRGRGPYRRGEPIPLELRFGAASGFDARIDEATRPGDIRWEWAEVDGPAVGWIDPLDAELALFAWRSVCGNFATSRAAQTIETHLNEWVFFRKPGRFRIFFRSQRTSGPAPESISSIHEIEIVEPDEAWTRRHWRTLMERWEIAAKRKEAARDIGYLGTLTAAEFLAHRLGDSHFTFAPFLLVSPVEALTALRAVPAELRRQSTYTSLRNFTWMRMLNPLRVRYGPDRRFSDGTWRSRLETELALLNGAIVWMDWF